MSAALRMMRRAEGQYFSPMRYASHNVTYDANQGGGNTPANWNGIIAGDLSTLVLSANVGERPVFQTADHADAINGYPVVDFDGTNDHYDRGANDLWDFKRDERWHVFWLGRPTATADLRAVLGKRDGTAQQRGWWVNYRDSAGAERLEFVIQSDVAGDRLWSTFNTDAGGAVALMELAYDGTQAAAGQDALRDGTLLTRAVVTDALTASIANLVAGELGNNPSGAVDWSGELAFCVTFHGNNTSGVLDAEHAYRVRRWLGQLGGIEISGGPVTL